MDMDIYYFTGTGNCLWAARAIAERTGGRAIAIRDVIALPAITPQADTIAIVFPAYLAALHGVPLMVERFLGKLEGMDGRRLIGVCTCGGYELVNAVPSLHSFSRSARANGLRLASGYTVRLPMNNLDYEHIPVPIETDSATIVASAEGQIDDICSRITRRKRGKHHLSRQLITLALTPMYSAMAKSCMRSLRDLAKEPEDSPLGFRELMPLTDRSIRVDERCTGCGICAKVCPADNIELTDGRPRWLHGCEMCFACDEWCPQGAIHHWGRPNDAKYHHPVVKAKDLYAGP